MTKQDFSGHTDGPWYGGEDNKSLGIDGTFIHEFHGDTIHNIARALPLRHANNKSRSERLANARLIAAAPELLAENVRLREALTMMLTLDDYTTAERHFEIVNLAQQALQETDHEGK